jgi:hypothetical protein
MSLLQSQFLIDSAFPLVIPSTSVASISVSTDEILLLQFRTLSGISRSTWQYHRLWYIGFGLTPMRAAFLKVGLSSEQAMMCGSTLSVGTFVLLSHQ